MARDSHKVPYRGLNIASQVISTLHGRPRRSTHFNTIRAEYRAQNGETTKPYIAISRNRIQEMRDMGNIIPLGSGHMKLSPQARRTMNLILSDPNLPGNKQAKCVNVLSGILRNRKISRERSILEVASTVTGSILPSQPPRNPGLIPPREPVAGLPALGVQPFPEVVNNGPDEVVEEPHISRTPAVEKPGPSQHPAARRTITPHGTEVFYGLVTPGNSPVKAHGNPIHLTTDSSHPTHDLRAPQAISIADDKDIEMADILTNDSSPTPSPGPSFGSLPPLESKPQSEIVAALENKIASLAQEKAVLLEREQYVLRKLSRNGQGTLSNIEAVTDRAVQQRDELRAENQELQAVIEHLKSGIINLEARIIGMQNKLDRAQGERIEMAQSRRHWIARVWALAGRIPGELRKKDAEIENMREKLIGMHALLAEEQSQLQEIQGKFFEERKRRVDIEVEFNDLKIVHAQEIEERDLTGRRLRNQLMSVVDGLGSGSISI